MKKYYVIYCIVVILSISFLSGCINPQVTDYFNSYYEADENTHLQVSTINGQIEIYNWEGDNISFNAVKKSSFGREELDKIDINVIQNEGYIEIETTYNGDRSSLPSVDMNIKVPEYVYVESATTSNGAIQITGTKGDIIASSSNGAIIIEDVIGYVTATTSNGRIDVKGTTGIKNLKTSNLGITAEIYDFQENISISSSNGGINIYLNPLLNATIEMTTSNGQISINELSLNMTISEDKYKVGNLGQGGNKIDISTSNGNIRLNKLE